MLPPSATVLLAVSVSVVVSIVSVTVVTAATGSMASGMPPPEVLAMVALMLVGSTYTSSLAATGTLAVPLRAPAAMVITAPLERVTSSAVVGACVTLAV